MQVDKLIRSMLQHRQQKFEMVILVHCASAERDVKPTQQGLTCNQKNISWLIAEIDL